MATRKKRRAEPVLVEAQFARLDQRLNRLAALITGHHENVARVREMTHNRITAGETRIEMLEKQLAEATAFMGHWGERIQKLDQRADKLCLHVGDVELATKGTLDWHQRQEQRVYALETLTAQMERGIVAELKRTGSTGPKLLFKNPPEDGAGVPKPPVHDFVVEAPEAKELFDIGCELGKLAARVEEMRKRKR